MKPLLPVPKPARRERIRFDPVQWQRDGRKPIARKKPMKRFNAKNRYRRFKAAYLSPLFVAYVKSLACSVPGCPFIDIDAAHVDRPRSRGGRWFEIAPLCRIHHRQQEKRTDAFNREHGIDLYDIAHQVAMRWKIDTKGADR